MLFVKGLCAPGSVWALSFLRGGLGGTLSRIVRHHLAVADSQRSPWGTVCALVVESPLLTFRRRVLGRGFALSLCGAAGRWVGSRSRW